MRLLTQSIDGGILMNRIFRLLTLLLAFIMLFTVPASAQEISPYASNFFLGYGANLEEVSGSTFEVWFSVSAVGTMTKLGVNYIDIERSSNGTDWTVVKTYEKADYSSLIASNTGFHSGHVTYSNRQSGNQYRAYVEFYAKNGSGSASY